jgi:hypothetical protein
VLAQLESVAGQLDDAIAHCKDSCCIEEQPWWQPLRSLDPAAREALRQVVVQEERPRIRALAIHWLAAAENADDLGLVERFVDSSEPAWRAPVPVISQAAMPCYPVASIGTLTVGGVALSALGRITGKRFEQVAEYRAWREAHATPANSISYWHLRGFPFLGGDECRDAMVDLGNRDPALLTRLAVAIWHRFHNPVPECPTIEQVAPILRTRYGQERLLAHLRDPSTWRPDRDPDYAKDTDWRHFAIWALSNAEALFDASHGDAIVALTTLDIVVRDPEILGHAAVAASRIRPAARDKIMDDALAHISSPPPIFVQEFARYRPKHSAVKKWFVGSGIRNADDRFAAKLSGEPTPEAAARGLCLSGKDGIAVARALARDPSTQMVDRPGLIGALIDGVLARGAPASQFSCRQELVYICHKVSADVCQREERKEQKARRACLEAFERWASRL